jgi:ribosomal protein S18 acetylase RimI-like enzyme
MRADELDDAIGVWFAANVARGQPPTAARVARVRTKLTEPGAIVLVAAEDRVVGMLLAEPGRTDDGAGATVPWFLHASMVFVHPGARRRGAGTVLLRRLFDDAKADGVTLVGLWTSVTNRPARLLYERVGMIAAGTRAVSHDRQWVRYEWRPRT